MVREIKQDKGFFSYPSVLGFGQPEGIIIQVTQDV
jgi:hypothetical protein